MGRGTYRGPLAPGGYLSARLTTGAPLRRPRQRADTAPEGAADALPCAHSLGVVPAKPAGTSRQEAPQRVAVGRRVFLGLVGLGAAGIVFGAKVQNVLSGVVGSGLGGLLPLGDHFRIYSISGTFPVIPRSEYRLEVTGLVDRPQTYTLEDLESMPRTAFVKDFHCVTGWSVSAVHWEGVRLSEILDAVGVQKTAGRAAL